MLCINSAATLLMGMLFSVVGAVAPNDLCSYAFTQYFYPADLSPAIRQSCVNADCSIIFDNVLNNSVSLRDEAETKKTQQTYLANQQSGEWCAGNGLSPASASCQRDLDQRMAIVNSNYQTNQVIANQYQRDMMAVYSEMSTSNKCSVGSMSKKPDLIVDSVQAFLSNSGDSIYFSYIIVNIGTAASPEINVGIATQSAHLGPVTFPTLEPNEYVSDYRGTKIVDDVTDLAIFADVDSVADEFDEGNNLAESKYLTPVSSSGVKARALQKKPSRTRAMQIDILGRRFFGPHNVASTLRYYESNSTLNIP